MAHRLSFVARQQADDDRISVVLPDPFAPARPTSALERTGHVTSAILRTARHPGRRWITAAHELAGCGSGPRARPRARQPGRARAGADCSGVPARLAAPEEEVFRAFPCRREFTQAGGKPRGDRTVRSPWRDLGIVSCPSTIARRTCTAGSFGSRSITCSAIASEIRRPVAANRSKNGRHSSGISSSRPASWLRVRKRRSTNSCGLPPRRRGRTSWAHRSLSTSPSPWPPAGSRAAASGRCGSSGRRADRQVPARESAR